MKELNSRTVIWADFFEMSSVAKILTELQEMLAPLAYARFEKDDVYGLVCAKIEALRAFGVDELLLGTIDFQTRVILGMESGDPAGAAAAVLNEIAVWKDEHGQV